MPQATKKVRLMKSSGFSTSTVNYDVSSEPLYGNAKKAEMLSHAFNAKRVLHLHNKTIMSGSIDKPKYTMIDGVPNVVKNGKYVPMTRK